MISLRQVLTLAIGLVVAESVLGQPSTCPFHTSAQQLLPLAGDGYALSDAELRSLDEIPTDSPIWPIATFLAGEHRWAKGERDADTFRNLVAWAYTDPYRDGWGGNSLAVFALWRWLSSLQTDEPSQAEVAKALKMGSTLLETRLSQGLAYRGAGRFYLLPSLPQLEEQVLRSLARLAWKQTKPDMAEQFFLEFLNVSTSEDFDEVESKIYSRLVDNGMFSEDRLSLYRGKRLIKLKAFDPALKHLTDALGSDDNQVRAEAGLLFAEHSRFRRPRLDNIQTLTEVIEIAKDPDLLQRGIGITVTLLHARRTIRLPQLP